MMSGTYNPLLVGLSFLVSALGSYTALRVTHHARRDTEAPEHRAFWIWSAAVAMGAGGIWSMHFIAMAAYELTVPVRYDLLLTAGSLVVAIGATWVGFRVAVTPPAGGTRLAAAGAAMGLGIGGMHYLGMAAMRMPASIDYDASLVVLSLLIGIGASIGALHLAVGQGPRAHPVAAPLVMAVAVSGMHYTGMAAVRLSAGVESPLVMTINLNPSTLAYGVFLVSMIVLSLQLGVAVGTQSAHGVPPDLG